MFEPCQKGLPYKLASWSNVLALSVAPLSPANAHRNACLESYVDGSSRISEVGEFDSPSTLAMPPSAFAPRSRRLAEMTHTRLAKVSLVGC